uniref:Uncharacterized protein n=1 Tax=Meloidogyne enterolobii TaxID=390850 RepID=A0A6V7XCQ1_MELEN|nr:unnamed protein product [Meloidogyne enterolobii]
MLFLIILFELINYIYSQQYTNNQNKIYPSSGFINQQQQQYPFYYQNKLSQQGLPQNSLFGRSSPPSPSSSFFYPPYYFGSNGYGTNLGNYYQPYREINNGKSIFDCIPPSPINSPNNAANLQQFGTGGHPSYPPQPYHGGTIDFGGNSKGNLQQNYNNGINSNNNDFPPYFYKNPNI